MKLRVAKKVLQGIGEARYTRKTIREAADTLARHRRRRPLFLLDGHGRRLAPGKPPVYLTFDMGSDWPPLEVLDRGSREGPSNQTQAGCNSAGDSFTFTPRYDPPSPLQGPKS